MKTHGSKEMIMFYLSKVFLFFFTQIIIHRRLIIHITYSTNTIDRNIIAPCVNVSTTHIYPVS